MVVLEWITAVLLLVGIGGTGVMKLSGNKEGIEQAERLGYANIRIPVGVVEVLGAAGVVLGAAISDLEPLGAAAAAGIIVLMLGAQVPHVRVGDKFERIPSAVLVVVAALYLVALSGN